MWELSEYYDYCGKKASKFYSYNNHQINVHLTYITVKNLQDNITQLLKLIANISCQTYFKMSCHNFISTCKKHSATSSRLWNKTE